MLPNKTPTHVQAVRMPALSRPGRDPRRENELCCAAEAADLDAALKLLSPQDGSQPVSANAKDDDGTPALVLACSSAEEPPERVLKIASALLAHGCNIDAVNERDQSGRLSPLMAAISMERPEVVRFLVEAGASLYQTDSHEQEPLAYALGADPRVLQVFIDAVKDKLGHDGFVAYAARVGAFYRAGRFGDCESADILLQAGAGVNDPDDIGRRPLDRVAALCYSNKTVEGLRHLLKLGAQIGEYTWRATPPEQYEGERGWATPKAMWTLMLATDPSEWPEFSAKDAGFAPSVPVSRMAAAMYLGDHDALMCVLETGGDLSALHHQAQAIAIASRSIHHTKISQMSDSLALVDAWVARRMITSINQSHLARQAGVPS